ncbi:lariat debranching enzyme, C-terminal domain-containing protein [Scenedesmus sp. NREL 46B-D3]|nr:lariat debranching enzyme, C-terminal domain-containing protein [Scenedesmus sp. NREL 46B-D3]
MLAAVRKRAVHLVISASTRPASSSRPKPVRHSKPRKMQQLNQGPGERKKFTVAIEGCCHGELDNIYATLAHLEGVEGRKVDLLICCGDFQAVRNLDDLETMSCPVKYRDIMTFYKYYSGEKLAPVPTLFIGGNHEATNYLWELHYGGWAAPNIYFLGYAGAVCFGGHRIAGLSGTYVAQHYHMGHHEKLPYDDRAVRSAYHVRQLHVHRLMQLQQPTSIFLSHDWPNLITRYGNSSWLFKKKPYFQKEAERGDLGSPANQQLLETLQPDYWFSAHLHVKFPAVVPHDKQQKQQKQQCPGDGQKATRFLALDKCLPGRDFLQVVELDVQGPLELCYDAEWLAVLRSTHQFMSTTRTASPLPATRSGPKPADLAFVQQLLQQRGSSSIPANFAPTAPAYDPAAGRKRGNMPSSSFRNPQTEALLSMLGLPYNLDHAANSSGAGGAWMSKSTAAATGGALPTKPR